MPARVAVLMDPHEMDPNERANAFLPLYARHEPQLRGFVLALVPDWNDAQDVMQQVSLVLWRKFDQFRPGTNFLAWACQVARLEAKDHRERRGRERALFSAAFVEAVADEALAMSDELGDRQQALQRCLERLPEPQRRMLLLRYESGATVDAVAAAVGRSVEAVYKSLSRVRQALMECVDRKVLAADRRPGPRPAGR